MNDTENNWAREQAMMIEAEARRVIARAKEARSELRKTYPKVGAVAALNRATLDFNMVAVKLRKGYYECRREAIEQ